MPEQLLDDAQVGSALEQVRCERVAQRVWADPVREARARGCTLDRGPGLLTSEPPTPIAEEEGAAAERGDVAESEQRDARAVDPAPEPVERHVAHRHEPLLIALADDPDEGSVDRQVLSVEPDRLADPQAGGVEELEEGAVTQGAAGGDAGGLRGRVVNLVAAGGLEEAVNHLD